MFSTKCLCVWLQCCASPLRIICPPKILPIYQSMSEWLRYVPHADCTGFDHNHTMAARFFFGWRVRRLINGGVSVICSLHSSLKTGASDAISSMSPNIASTAFVFFNGIVPPLERFRKLSVATAVAAPSLTGVASMAANKPFRKFGVAIKTILKSNLRMVVVCGDEGHLFQS